MIDALTKAFSQLSQRPEPPKTLLALTYSEKKYFDKAIAIYSSLPEAAELRSAFHCSMAVAEKVHVALVSYFQPVTKRRRK
jgi:hypothetical protein